MWAWFLLIAIGTGCGKKQAAIGPESLTCNGVRTVTPTGQTCTEPLTINQASEQEGNLIFHSGMTLDSSNVIKPSEPTVTITCKQWKPHPHGCKFTKGNLDKLVEWGNSRGGAQ